MRLSPLFLLWIAWAAGLAITVGLAWQGVEAIAMPGCGAHGDCSGVLGSSYSRLLGVSLTSYALVYYAVAGGLLATSPWLGRRTVGPLLWLLLAILSSGAVTMGLWAVAIMVFVLQMTCPWCLAIHVANAVFFILSIVSARSRWKSSQRQRIEQDLPALSARIPAVASLAAVLLCAWQVSMLLVFADDGRLRVVNTIALGDGAELRQFDGNPIALLGLDDDAPMPTFKGRADAPDRLVMMSCYTCPKCQEMNRRLRRIIDRHPDRLRVDIRMAPLSPLCNPIISKKAITAKHRVACAAARAALAVARVRGDAFSEFSDWLYLHRETMFVEQIIDEGRRSVGADPFDRAFDSAAVAARLEADVALVARFGANSVPRLYIRQGQIRGFSSDANLERFLAEKFEWPGNSVRQSGP